MKTLEIKNFKAYQNLDEINFAEKNFLLYGDNGAGKSSIYEALRFCYFRERLEQNIESGSTPENISQLEQDFYSEFNNKISNQDFEIKINSTNFKDFNSDEYNVYMLKFEDVIFEKTLSLEDFLGKLFTNLPPFDYFKKQINPHAKKLFERTKTRVDSVQEKTNKFLKECFEDIEVEIDISDDFAIKLKNKKRNIKPTKDLRKYFNEGKINLVLLALFFTSIDVSKDLNKKNILILDDFITSLDMANRTFLMRYIFGTFKDFQILVFTHNVYFYNMAMYLINDKICETTKPWQFANLYEIDDNHKIYINSDFASVKDIESEYNQEIKKTNPNLGEIGNKLRQKFERLLYELSKILMIGGVEESNKILETILENQSIYILKYEDISTGKKKIKYKNANHLTTEIKSISTNLADVQAKINEYEINSFDEIKEVLKTLKLYRKVTMHSLSHGQIGQHNWNNKEIEQTLLLLKRLETNIKDLTNVKVN